jgi:hypothetical protein
MFPIHEVFALGIAGMASVAIARSKAFLPEKDVRAVRKHSDARVRRPFQTCRIRLEKVEVMMHDLDA